MENSNQPSTNNFLAVKGPKALFWYLGLFFTCSITAFSTGGLWFQFVNKFFPTEINYGVAIQSLNQTAIKWEMASLIVALPLFFVFSWLIRQALKKGNLLAESKIRLWISYIILFIVVATAIGDLITTTFSLLNGDFTARFLLKSLTILLISLWIFIYYWLELRSENALVNTSLPKIFGTITLVVIIGSFIGTFFIIESPVQARKNAFDQTRVGNLQDIKYAVDDYYREYQKLPDSLSELRNNRGYLKITDPANNQNYGYKIVDPTSYEICATFETSSKNQNNHSVYSYYTEFVHDAGNVCFSKKISKSDLILKNAPVAPIEN